MSRARSIWWDPREPGWWVACLFAVGSTAFLVGATPGYLALVGVRADGVTYFVGSIFFTAAALLQVMVATGAVKAGTRSSRAARWRTLRRAPHDAGWWAGMVQFAGTLLFNVSTFLALEESLTAVEANRRVWAPDALGSVAFLVASGLAFSSVRRPWFRWGRRDLAWSVAVVNLVGSVAFGASAVGAKVLTTTGDLRNAQIANGGTFVGAVCFLVGSVLLIPEEAHEVDAEAASAAG